MYVHIRTVSSRKHHCITSMAQTRIICWLSSTPSRCISHSLQLPVNHLHHTHTITTIGGASSWRHYPKIKAHLSASHISSHAIHSTHRSIATSFCFHLQLIYMYIYIYIYLFIYMYMDACQYMCIYIYI